MPVDDRSPQQLVVVEQSQKTAALAWMANADRIGELLVDFQRIAFDALATARADLGIGDDDAALAKMLGDHVEQMRSSVSRLREQAKQLMGGAS